MSSPQCIIILVQSLHDHLQGNKTKIEDYNWATISKYIHVQKNKQNGTYLPVYIDIIKLCWLSRELFTNIFTKENILLETKAQFIRN